VRACVIAASYPGAKFYDLPQIEAGYDFGSLSVRQPRAKMDDPNLYVEVNDYANYLQKWLCAVPSGAPALKNPNPLWDLGCGEGTDNCNTADFGMCWDG